MYLHWKDVLRSTSRSPHLTSAAEWPVTTGKPMKIHTKTHCHIAATNSVSIELMSSSESRYRGGRHEGDPGEGAGWLTGLLLFEDGDPRKE